MGGIPVQQWSELLATIAHPTRMTILLELAQGTRCVGDIQELLAVPQPNVSQHLAVLKNSGLVVSHKRGVSRCYCLAKPGLVRDLFAVLGRDYPTVDACAPEACDSKQPRSGAGRPRDGRRGRGA